jgi:hypothetical protein
MNLYIAPLMKAITKSNDRHAKEVLDRFKFSK